MTGQGHVPCARPRLTSRAPEVDRDVLIRSVAR